MDLNIDDKPIFYIFPKGMSKNGGVDVNPAEWTSLHGSKVTNHYALEDASGDAAIIEFVGGQMNVCHGAKFTTLTNDPSLPQMPDLLRYRYFGGRLPLLGDLDSASRFVRASAFLSTLDTAFSNPDPNYPKPTPVAAMLSAIRTVAEPFGCLMPYGGSNDPDWRTLLDRSFRFGQQESLFQPLPGQE